MKIMISASIMKNMCNNRVRRILEYETVSSQIYQIAYKLPRLCQEELDGKNLSFVNKLMFQSSNLKIQAYLVIYCQVLKKLVAIDVQLCTEVKR